ncbi:hypothetical protein ACSLVK_10640 [Photorhabdus tasmaniensis]|uniref:hypothetical protein n=1 Tax=Photorhabdus tasmaniensis TaxID=1004159 RepID=UPI00404234FB
MQTLYDFESECKLIRIDTPEAKDVVTYQGRGRPSKDKQPDVHYQLSGRVYSQLDKVAYAGFPVPEKHVCFLFDPINHKVLKA